MVSRTEALAGAALGFTALVVGWTAWVQSRYVPGIPRLKPMWFGIVGDIPYLIKWLNETKSTAMSQWIVGVGDTLGPVCQLVMAGKRLILVSDAQEIEDIMARRKEFDKSESFISMFIGTCQNSQMTMKTTPMFKLHRRIFGPAMTNRYLSQMTPRIARGAKGLVELWENKRVALAKARTTEAAAWSAAFEAATDLIYWTTDVIVDLTCGHHWGCVSNATQDIRGLPALKSPENDGAIFEFPDRPVPMFHVLHLLFQAMASIVVSSFPTLSRTMEHIRPSWRSAMAKLRAYIQGEIAHRREEIGLSISTGDRVHQVSEKDSDNTTEYEADCIVTMVLKQGGDQKIPTENLEDELMAILFGGQDTTAAALAWSVKYLASFPQVQQNLRNELLALLSSIGRSTDISSPEDVPSLTFADVNGDSTPYLDAVVAECLRCAGVATAASRNVMQDTTVLGYKIPKGSLLVLASGRAGNHNNINRRKTHPPIPFDSQLRSPTSRAAALKGVWDDDATVLNFKPERWLNFERNEAGKTTMKFDGNKGYNMQFGGGPRGCFGKALAYLEMKVCLATLCLYFFFDQVPSEVSGYMPKEIVTTQPVFCYVAPRRWSEIEKRT